MFVTLVCHGCNKTFQKTRKSFNSHQRLKRKHHYCSTKCLHKWQSIAFRKERKRKKNTIKAIFPKDKKRCFKCGLVKNKDEFGVRDNGKRSQSYCKPCQYSEQAKRWNRRKKEAIEYLGGNCTNCGIIGHPAIYDFHHRDPSQKDFDWYKLRLRKWDTVLKELDKCNLVCSNCHRLKHIKEKNWDYGKNES